MAYSRAKVSFVGLCQCGTGSRPGADVGYYVASSATPPCAATSQATCVPNCVWANGHCAVKPNVPYTASADADDTVWKWAMFGLLAFYIMFLIVRPYVPRIYSYLRGTNGYSVVGE